jgi:hypothetical protein
MLQKLDRVNYIHVKNKGFIIIREPCINQRPRWDIAWLHVTNHLYHSFPELNGKTIECEKIV